MGFLDLFKSRPDEMQIIYDLLYADLPLKRLPLYMPRPGDASREGASPLLDEEAGTVARLLPAVDAAAGGSRENAVTLLTGIVAALDTDTRTRLLAWRGLRDLKQAAPPGIARVPRGVVCEVPLGNGSDVVACYEDHTARLYAPADGTVLWKAQDPTMSSLIDVVLAQAAPVAASTGATGDFGLRLPVGAVSMTVLTYAGRHLAVEEVKKLESGQSAHTALFRAVQKLRAELARRAP